MRLGTPDGNYRPDIDGLRAVAVAGVMLYHWGFPGFAGGLAGVDVFFVISGFLITGILERELRHGDFSIKSFYERRIRRIFPALFVMMGATALLCWMVVAPPDLEQFGQSLAASSVFAPNFYFLAKGSYFAPAAQHMPLLHLWSLGVEEQFYLLFPWFLLGGWLRFRRAMTAAVAAAALLSFLLALWLGGQSESALFYFSGARFWELLLGSLLALTPRLRFRGRWADVAGVAGLALVSLAIFGWTIDAAPTGANALVPCLGAVLLLACDAQRRDIATRILSVGPLVFVGLISYSLYLWHWPLLVLYRTAYPLNEGIQALPIVGTVIIAACSWRWVEQPLRKSPAASGQVFGLAGLAMLLALGAAAFLVATKGGLSRHPPEAQWLYSFYDYKPKETLREGQCFLPPKRVDPTNFDPATCLARQAGKQDYLLLGDSHAAHLWYGLAQALPEINLQQATASGCRPLLAGPRQLGCARFIDQIVRTGVVEGRPAAVILAARWREADIEPLRETVAMLLRSTDKVIVIGPTVEYREDLPRLLVLAAQGGGDTVVSGRRVPGIAELDRRMRGRITETGAHYISLYEALCPADGARCRVVSAVDGAPLQFDYGHFTHQGSVYVGRELRSQLLIRPEQRNSPAP